MKKEIKFFNKEEIANTIVWKTQEQLAGDWGQWMMMEHCSRTKKSVIRHMRVFDKQIIWIDL